MNSSLNLILQQQADDYSYVKKDLTYLWSTMYEPGSLTTPFSDEQKFLMFILPLESQSFVTGCGSIYRARQEMKSFFWEGRHLPIQPPFLLTPRSQCLVRAGEQGAGARRSRLVKRSHYQQSLC